MKNKLLIVPLLMALTGCSQMVEGKGEGGDKIIRDYSDYQELHLEWKNLFLLAKSLYFVYIYSISCLHCQHIKEVVLDAVEANKDFFYLIEYSDEIKTSVNTSDTIGKEKVEEVTIMGTPTLLEISDYHVAINIAGENEILGYLQLLPHKSCE